jgi:hypothetical protein
MPTRKRRGRTQRGKLRRHQEIDHVVVEDTFLLNRPMQASSSESRWVGEGCYISATVQNRRFHGVLIDQAALQQASLLHFQEEASGMDLERRMRALMKNRDNGHTVKLRKRLRTDGTSVTSNDITAGRQVQKFRYEIGLADSQGYRVLLATFVDVDAASDHDHDWKMKIEAACRAGGEFVGDYYYQYEVRSFL